MFTSGIQTPVPKTTQEIYKGTIKQATQREYANLKYKLTSLKKSYAMNKIRDYTGKDYELLFDQIANDIEAKYHEKRSQL